MKKKEKQKDVGTKKKGRTGVSRVMRNRMIEVAGDAPGTIEGFLAL